MNHHEYGHTENCLAHRIREIAGNPAFQFQSSLTLALFVPITKDGYKGICTRPRLSGSKKGNNIQLHRIEQREILFMNPQRRDADNQITSIMIEWDIDTGHNPDMVPERPDRTEGRKNIVLNQNDSVMNLAYDQNSPFNAVVMQATFAESYVPTSRDFFTDLDLQKEYDYVFGMNDYNQFRKYEQKLYNDGHLVSSSMLRIVKNGVVPCMIPNEMMMCDFDPEVPMTHFLDWNRTTKTNPMHHMSFTPILNNFNGMIILDLDAKEDMRNPNIKFGVRKLPDGKNVLTARGIMLRDAMDLIGSEVIFELYDDANAVGDRGRVAQFMKENRRGGLVPMSVRGSMRVGDRMGTPEEGTMAYRWRISASSYYRIPVPGEKPAMVAGNNMVAALTKRTQYTGVREVMPAPANLNDDGLDPVTRELRELQMTISAAETGDDSHVPADLAELDDALLDEEYPQINEDDLTHIDDGAPEDDGSQVAAVEEETQITG